jgi:N-methylhydantoinase A
VAGRFHAEHRALYGYDFSTDASQQVEWVNLRVSGIGPIRRPEIKRVPVVEEGALRPSRNPGTRDVCFDADQGYVATPVVNRSDLPSGAHMVGPMIIEEFGSTVPVHPGFQVRVDEFLNLIVTRADA